MLHLVDNLLLFGPLEQKMPRKVFPHDFAFLQLQGVGEPSQEVVIKENDFIARSSNYPSLRDDGPEGFGKRSLGILVPWVGI